MECTEKNVSLKLSREVCKLWAEVSNVSWDKGQEKSFALKYIWCIPAHWPLGRVFANGSGDLGWIDF